MEKSLSIEVLTEHVLVMNECMNCQLVWSDIESEIPIHQQQALAHLHGMEALEYLNVSSWVVELLHRYGDQVQIRIIDANSLEGVVKSDQYHIHSYPAVVINRRDVYHAFELEEAAHEVEDILNNKDVHPHEIHHETRHSAHPETNQVDRFPPTHPV